MKTSYRYDVFVSRIESPKMICVVIPSYRTKAKILGVISNIGPEVEKIIVVDDKCPEHSGKHVEANCKDKRVLVLYNSENGGVGASTIRGYQQALREGADVIVKIDGDGQMDPRLISNFISPILSNQADYVKGNRFWNLSHVRAMPRVRLLGNIALSFFAKASTGFWNLFDPNNGFTVIKSSTLKSLPLEQIDRRYFFESDMLFHLGLVGARVRQVSMESVYDDEQSSLKIHKVLFEFLYKHTRNLLKRIGYTYFLRDFSFASINLIFGVSLLLFSLTKGISSWIVNSRNGVETELGTQFLVAITFISGLQLFLSFVNEDVNRANMPRNESRIEINEI